MVSKLSKVMKNITTIVACTALCIYGFTCGFVKTIPQNTVAASENYSLASVLSPITKHDTVTVTKTDTVKERVVVKVKQPNRKTKRTSYEEFERVSAQIKLDSVREVRKGTPPDTGMTEIHGWFKPMSENR